MRKGYYLSTCSTCKKIIDSLALPEGFVLQDIKHETITEEQLEEMKALAGSYETLFTKRSRKYRALNLHEQELSEEDYRKYILEEYTFLKRPVFIIDDEIFIGNTKKTKEALAEKVQSLT